MGWDGWMCADGGRGLWREGNGDVNVITYHVSREGIYEGAGIW